jgi:hypothetical protein
MLPVDRQDTAVGERRPQRKTPPASRDARNVPLDPGAMTNDKVGCLARRRAQREHDHDLGIFQNGYARPTRARRPPNRVLEGRQRLGAHQSMLGGADAPGC